MSTTVKYHRLGAFIYGFLSGTGLIMIIWGLASITMLPSTNLLTNVGLTLLGVVLFACGSCREAYLRGGLMTSSESAVRKHPNRPRAVRPVSVQIVDGPEELEEQEAQVA